VSGNNPFDGRSGAWFISKDITGNVYTVNGDFVDKLAEYEDLDEKGLLLRLPCKVGDTVWGNDFGKTCSYEVTGFSIGNLNKDDDWYNEALNQVIVFYANGNGGITERFAVSEIGKIVFLTKSDAEQALAKWKEMMNR
jgi:hypothetical protein